jgi:ABC-type sugar transport system substrate-binding protein
MQNPRAARTLKLHWRLLAAAGAAAALVSACHNNDDNAYTPPPVNTAVPFTIFAQQAFANAANSTPVAVNNINFDFDSNDDPTAFNNLIAEGSF